MSLHTQLFHYLGRPLRPRLYEAGEADPGKIAKNSDVVEAEAARADDTDARKCLQITTPRSLASTKRMSSLTSGKTSSSVCARSIACETLRSERKNNLYARFSSRIVSSSIPLRCNPTVLRPYSFTGFPTAL